MPEHLAPPVTPRSLRFRPPPLRGCSSCDERADEPWHFLELGVPNVRDLEALGLDRVERSAIAVAAGDELVQAVEAVLPACEAGLVGADVLDEDQPAGGAEHPAWFSEGTRLVVDSAEHEGRYRNVEGIVVERQLLGRRLDDLCVRRLLLDPPRQTPQHRRLWLRDRQRFYPGAVMGEVRACAASDLEYLSGRA